MTRYGSEVVAKACRERARKWGKEAEANDGRWRWARWDSSPAEKAKEPRGRAESARRRSACEGVEIGGGKAGRSSFPGAVEVGGFSLSRAVERRVSRRAISARKARSSAAAFIGSSLRLDVGDVLEWVSRGAFEMVGFRRKKLRWKS